MSRIESTPEKDRAKVIEMTLNDFGIRVSTTGMSEESKLEVIGKMIRAKERRYLIVAITSFCIVLVLSFLVYFMKTDNPTLRESDRQAKVDSIQLSDTSDSTTKLIKPQVNSHQDASDENHNKVKADKKDFPTNQSPVPQVKSQKESYPSTDHTQTNNGSHNLNVNDNRNGTINYTHIDTSK
ncbi:MAG: hypothetical protein JSS76_04640 [Bacteroidetes bacterium]|nr:hypothetical protein [Bacteroidota bacterium]